MNGAICVDASVAVKWVLPEEGSDKALALLDDALRAGRDVIGPPHLPIEVTSAIYKRLRLGEMRPEEARERLRAFSAIPADLVFPEGLAEKGWILLRSLIGRTPMMPSIWRWGRS